jgi:CcmD family protein
MSNGSYVLTAYLLSWAVIAGYAVFVSRRLRHAQDSIENAPVHTEVDS